MHACCFEGLAISLAYSSVDFSQLAVAISYIYIYIATEVSAIMLRLHFCELQLLPNDPLHLQGYHIITVDYIIDT